MRRNLAILFAMMGSVLLGCSASADYSVSSKMEFGQSTPDDAVKQMINLVERDDFSGVEQIFSESAMDDFKVLERHKLPISMNVRGLPLNELQLDVQLDGGSAVITPNKKLRQLLRTDEVRLALESNQWKITDANFQF